MTRQRWWQSVALAALVLGIAATPAWAGFVAHTGSPFATGGTGAWEVVAADVDGDGRRDLLVTNLQSDDLSVLRQTAAMADR